MAKVQIKSERITPFGGIFQVRELFSRFVGPVIDKVEIAGSLASVYFCGGDCVEDVTSHLMPHLSLHPTLRTCSSDTILRGISGALPIHNHVCSGKAIVRWRGKLQNVVYITICCGF